MVVNVKDVDDDPSSNRYAQGTLRQFIQNANAIAGENHMRFVPMVPPNSGDVNGRWWTITVNLEALPWIKDDNTIIDGTAYYPNGTVRDENPGVGSGSHGGEPVGTGSDGIEGTGDEPKLPQYYKPELEINGNDAGSIIRISANSCTIKRVAMFNINGNNINYPWSVGDVGVYVNSGSGNIVTECFIGVRANGSDPGDEYRVDTGIYTYSSSNTIIEKNYIAYTKAFPIYLYGNGEIKQNDIYDCALKISGIGGIKLETSGVITVYENRIENPKVYGIDSQPLQLFTNIGSFVIENNTVIRCGLGGIRIFGDGSVIKHNVIKDNYGSGIIVARFFYDSSTNNLISKNAIYNNSGISIDLDQTSLTLTGDGVSPNNGTTDPRKQNIDMDYPIIENALLWKNTLYIKGYVGTPTQKIAGIHTIEVFKADDDGNNNGLEYIGGPSVPHGEGRWFIGDCTTNSDGTFSCAIPVPSAVSLNVGDNITATATDSNNNTSEFGANARVKYFLANVKASINITPVGDHYNATISVTSYTINPLGVKVYWVKPENITIVSMSGDYDSSGSSGIVYLWTFDEIDAGETMHVCLILSAFGDFSLSEAFVVGVDPR